VASALVNNGKNVALDGLAAVAVFASLHTATPDASGSNEVTGGSPAYARKAVTWAASSGGSKALSNAPAFDVPAGTTVAYVGLWSASSAGTFYGYFDVTDEVYAGQGTYTLSSGSISL
jgi:hypothetical protein